ncbi:MAG: hypothetical protein RL150_62 [Candidatus Parcubacteria bacterium]|jgi:glycosyltransferase involved in cell wall biosynthesis
MQRTSICYVITKSNFGGAQKYVFELATSLPPEAFSVTVALGGSGILKEKLDAAGIETVVIPHLDRDISIGKEFRALWFLYRLFTDRHFDIVHLNSSKVGGLGGLAARLAGIPRIIFTAHGFAFNEARSWPVKQLIKLSYFVTMLLADTTIAVSHAIRTQVSGWPLIARRITVIQNAVQPIAFKERTAARAALHERHTQLDLSKRWVGTLAELHPIKGIDVYIDAVAAIAAELPDCQFLVMGTGEQKERLEKQIAEKNLTDRFILLGYVDAAATYLKAFDCYVHPSRSEALCLAILEAGLAELPVVATRVGGIPEMIPDDTYGKLVPPDNSPALAYELNRMLTDTVTAKRAATALNERIQQSFTYETLIAKTAALYH